MNLPTLIIQSVPNSRIYSPFKARVDSASEWLNKARFMIIWGNFGEMTCIMFLLNVLK